MNIADPAKHFETHCESIIEIQVISFTMIAHVANK
jgi:hypothetical protein